MDGWMVEDASDGWMDVGWMLGGWLDGWMDGWVLDGVVFIIFCCFKKESTFESRLLLKFL
jgi:hypothetical protein